MKKNKKSKLSSFTKDKLNISNKEKEILESYKDIETDINNIEEYTIEEYISDNSSSNEIEEFEEAELSLDDEIEEQAKNKSKKEKKHKANKHKLNIQEEPDESEQELEEFQVDEAKEVEQQEETPTKKEKKLKRAKKEKKPKKVKVAEEAEDYEFEFNSASEENDETNLEEFDMEEYDEIKNINDEDNINDNTQETNNDTPTKKKNKLSVNLLINIFFAIVILLILLSVIDIVAVTRYEKGPYFSIAVKTYDDGGTKEYYGLGYKVIKYNQVLGRKDIELGTWGLKYNIEPIYLDAIDLAIEINEDEAKTYNKYYKKFMRISGILQKVDMDNNTITISYIDDGGKYNVDIICNMEQGQDIISQFEVNNEITVLGTMNNYKFKSKDNNPTIEMRNCFAEQ